MAVANVLIDTARPAGQKLDPVVRAEVEEIAPGTPPDGTVTEPKIADRSVGNSKLKLGAVDATVIAHGGVGPDNYEAGSVGTNALANGAVTAAKAGTGVATAHDTTGNPIALNLVPITAADHAALVSNGLIDPNTAYLIYTG